MEAVALKHCQHQTQIDYTPPTFDLGIPLSPERRCETVISSPNKTAHTISCSTAYNDEQVCLGESAHHKMQQEKHNARQRVEDEALQKPHRERRVIKLLPFICRSPYLRDYRDIIKDKLTHAEKVVIDYAFLSFDTEHPET